MFLELTSRRFTEVTFRELVWLFPVAYALHVAEELPRFTNWAQRHASPSFTMRDYLTLHLVGIAMALSTAWLIRYSPNCIVIFAFFTFVFTPAVFFNILFHAGATLAFGVYCPGLLTALTLYPVVFFIVSRQALREHLMSCPTAIVSFVLAGVVHAADVSHNVFKLW